MSKINPLDLQYDVAVGVALPLIYSNNNTFALNYTTIDQAKTNFKMLVLTNEGERIMEPEFGCSLYKFLFDNDLEIIADKVKAQIQRKTKEWLPYINIKRIDHTIESEHLVSFSIYWSLVYADDKDEVLSFKLSLN